MRITSLYNRNLKNRFAYWLYKKWCNELYIPKGKINALVERKGDTPASTTQIKISFTPQKFTPGIHEFYLFDSLNSEITFFKDLFDKK